MTDGQRIVGPVTLLTARDQARSLQSGEMSGSRRLRDLQARDEISYAHLAIAKEIDGTEPERVGEGREQQMWRRRGPNPHSYKRI